MRKSFLHSFLHLLYPSWCLGCKQYGTALCTNCLGNITLAPTLSHPDDYAVFDYGKTIVRRAIWEFKYHHNASAAKILTRAAAPYIAEHIADKLQGTTAETIVLVPMAQHRQKTASRGYNQSLLLARWLSTYIDQTVVQPLLIKTIPTIPQARTKNKTARMNNVKYSMRTSSLCNPKTIYIIVDDVTTTGATLNEARRALRQSGAKKILSVSIAHGYLST